MTNQTQILKPILAGQATRGLLIGNRIPKDYFITTGTGESDIAIHAGSYHLALKKADIEMCNIMTYSSILPGIATKIERPEQLVHGSVVESIMSVCHAGKGQRATAGIIYGWLYNKTTNEKYGGLVCEHYGNFSEDLLRNKLEASLEELYVNGFSDHFDLTDIEYITESFVPEKRHGTAITAICFTSYLYPVLE